MINVVIHDDVSGVTRTYEMIPDMLHSDIRHLVVNGFFEHFEKEVNRAEGELVTNDATEF